MVGISLAACLLQFFGIGAHTIHPASLIKVSANAAMNLETAPFETAPSIQQPPLTNIEIRLFAFVEAPEANADTIAIGDITLLFEESSQITSDVSVHFTLPEAIDKTSISNGNLKHHATESPHVTISQNLIRTCPRKMLWLFMRNCRTLRLQFQTARPRKPIQWKMQGRLQ